MKIIVGLGNPGEKYKNTRHNAGFKFLDALAGSLEISTSGSIKFQKNEKFEAEIAEAAIDGVKLLLVKPLTFMNLSGQAVTKILSFYKAGAADLIVVSDDIDLPVGTVRIRKDGSGGGQKGLQNIIDNLGEDISRIRIGVGPASGERGNFFDAVSFVLSDFSEREEPIIDESIAIALEYLLKHLNEKAAHLPDHTFRVATNSEG